MATIEIKGLDGYEELLKKLDANVNDFIKAGVYEGAKVIADEVRRELNAVPEDEKWGTENYKLYGLKKEQIEGLINGFGISKMEEERGFLNVLIGYQGYNTLKSERWPKGQPNAMIARVLESGTSFSQKIPIMKRTIAKIKEKSVEAAKVVIDKKIDAIKGGR